MSTRCKAPPRCPDSEELARASRGVSTALNLVPPPPRPLSTPPSRRHAPESSPIAFMSRRPQWASCQRHNRTAPAGTVCALARSASRLAQFVHLEAVQRVVRRSLSHVPLQQLFEQSPPQPAAITPPRSPSAVHALAQLCRASSASPDGPSRQHPRAHLEPFAFGSVTLGPAPRFALSSATNP
ncbi:hypothetical protein EXIGLDRAFT_781191 [Exidia glandulosa HHB12029]|uniref:Uncharacterized protein n=1 Tax=Exidia glandulosa HHB12029 TaxID=1314781 RepID=A0A165BBF4_EXIGL|nr:hypothetical protein EXIGLDRAFT_781191 [Exidia glandulosa HHB12029]